MPRLYFRLIWMKGVMEERFRELFQIPGLEDCYDRAMHLRHQDDDSRETELAAYRSENRDYLEKILAFMLGIDEENASKP